MSTRERFWAWQINDKTGSTTWTSRMIDVVADFADAEVRRALQPGDAAPDLAQAEAWIRSPGLGMPERYPEALCAELDRLRALLAAKSGDATKTAMTCAKDATAAVEAANRRTKKEAP